MIFNSFDFLVFFPIVACIYFVIPKRFKTVWLLISSYYFYMCWNVKYVLLIFTSTIVTYVSGLLIEKIRNSKQDENKQTNSKKRIIAVCFLINLGILFYFKYSNFAIDIVVKMLAVLKIQVVVPAFDILLPVGISFYTFQALSYIMDVYRGDIYAEKNFFQYALFVSFFPQLVAGPIERSKNLLKQLSEPKKFSYENAREGLMLVLWGYFLKIVMADRIAIFVDTVYNGYEGFRGIYYVVASMLFAVQIYCDFSGYSTIAMGVAKILGIELMENFDAPYLSTSVSEFWRRWHISLTSWFKDYLYIPLGGSRRGVWRKHLNRMIVFLLSGLWHGADISFVIWGGINGVYQIVGDVLEPIKAKLVRIFGLNTENISHKIVKIISTFLLVDISWVFFRANNISQAIFMFKSMILTRNIEIIFSDDLYRCGLDEKNFHLMLIGILIMLFADFCKYKKIKIREVILKQDYWFRWIFISIAIVFILTFGIWGPGYNSSNFIYFQF